MLLTIVIPAYRSPTLDRVLASLEGLDAEIVVVDSSPGGPPEVGPTARAIWLSEKTPPGVARNVGARDTHGEFILFLDSDVQLNAEGRAFVHAQIDCPEHDVVCGVYRFDPLSNGPIEAIQNAIIRYRLLRKPPGNRQLGSTSHMLVRRSTFDRVGGFDPELITYEDYEFTARCFRNDVWVTVDPAFEAIHLKQYTMLSLVTDYLQKVHASVLARRRHAPTFKGFDMNLGWPIGLSWIASFLLPFGLVMALSGPGGGVVAWGTVLVLAAAPIPLWRSVLAQTPIMAKLVSLVLWPPIAWSVALATGAATITSTFRKLRP